MSEVFEGYERQYCEISASLSRKCTSATHLNGEQKKQTISEIKTGLDDAEALIRKMDLEARSLQPSVKAALLAKLREYKSDLNNLKSELKRIASPNSNQATREELLESGMADTLAMHTKKRCRLEQKRLNDLVFVRFNQILKEKFLMKQERGDAYDPISLEEIDGTSEWLVDSLDTDIADEADAGSTLTWKQVDEAMGASEHTVSQRPRRGSSSSGARSRARDFVEEDDEEADSEDT